MNKPVVNSNKKVNNLKIEIPEELFKEILSDERIVDVKGGTFTVKELIFMKFPWPIGIPPIDFIKHNSMINSNSIVMKQSHKQIGM